MNIEAFLAAQLWLRPLPAQAWPTWTTTPTEAAARRGARDPDRKTTTTGTGVNARDGGLEGSGTVVLLPRARCCFVLENRPSTTAAAGVRKRSSSSSSNNDDRNASKKSRTLYLSTTRRGASDDESHGDGGSRATNKGVPDDDGNSAPGAREAQSCGGRPPGQSRGDPGISCYGFQQDNSGTVRPPRGKGQGEGCPITTTSRAESALAWEFDFGLAIARPTPPRGGHAKPRGGAGGGHLPPAEEEGGGGGTLLLRIEGKVYEAEHTLIRSIAYPRGGGSGGNGGAGAGNPRGPSDESGAAKPATSPVDGGNADSNRGRVDERGRGPMAVAKASSPPTPPPTASAVAGGKRKAGASNGDGAAGTGRGGSAEACDGLQEGAGRRGEVDSTEGAFGAAAGSGDGRGDRVDAAVAAAEAAEAETTQQKKRSGAGTPFCGLFFPGVLLKFWNSERTPARDGGDARAEAVTKMQGVVSEMLVRLSPNRSCHRATSASKTSPQELECLARSAVAEGEDTGFRRQYEAWDEFVYGSHVLFQEGYRRPQQCALDLWQQGGHGGGGSAMAGSVVRAPCSDWEGIDAPALCESIGNDSARLGGGGLSDVGRTRALTVLAECFRQASLPCPVSLVAQRRLDAASTSAGRELEDALDRAFPLDLSQGTDSTSRETTVSELKDSLRRVQAARKSVLALAILPASTILDESSGDAFA